MATNAGGGRKRQRPRRAEVDLIGVAAICSSVAAWAKRNCRSCGVQGQQVRRTCFAMLLSSVRTGSHCLAGRPGWHLACALGDGCLPRDSVVLGHRCSRVMGRS
jgi:hypothetical protein